MFLTFKHAPKLNSVLASLFALSSLAITSCQDEDFGYSADQIAYQSNFEKTYGKISKDQTWDLSSYNLKKLGLVGGPSNDFAAIGGAGTRAFPVTDPTILNAVRTTPYSTLFEVQPSTTNWLNENMTEKYNHKGEGEAFTLINPYWDESNTAGGRKDFLIIPIYQGATGMSWDLHLVDDQNDYNIWSKCDELYYSLDYANWEEYFYRHNDGSLGGGDYPNYTRINLGKAFDGRIQSNSEVFLYVELPVYNSKVPGSANGYVSGKFYVESGSTRKEITTIGQKSFSGVYRTNSQIQELGNPNIIELTGIINQEFGGITVNNQLSNLVFVPDNMQDCTLDPFAAQRIKFFVKITNPLVKSGDDMVSVVDTESGENTAYFTGHTINRNNVRSKAMRIDASKIGREFSLYLQTTVTNSDNWDYSKDGTKHRSNGNPPMMRALNKFSDGDSSPLTQSQLEAALSGLGIDASEYHDCEYMVIGCEDANGVKSDWDYNDVVLLFVGLPKVPQIARNVIQKRYMIEDLGSTFDFDFNDIVVDVTQEDILDIKANKFNRKQIVSIAHLCGTIPFEVYIGNETMGQIMGQNNDDSEDGFDPKTGSYYPYANSDRTTYYLKTFDGGTSWTPGSSVPDFSRTLPWEPDNNNIVVYVWPEAKSLSGTSGTAGIGSSGDGYENLLDIKKAQKITFPKVGQFPYIIAVDQDINWMKELVSVPDSWFYMTPGSDDNIIDDGYETPSNPNYDNPNNHPRDPEDFDEDLAAWKPNGIIVPTSNVVDNADRTSTIQIGSIFTHSSTRYHDGDIDIIVALSPKCADDYTMVKGKLHSTNYTLSDATLELKDFEQYIDDGELKALYKKITLTSEEMKAAAYAGDLSLVVSYSTFGFSEGWNPRARLILDYHYGSNEIFDIVESSTTKDYDAEGYYGKIVEGGNITEEGTRFNVGNLFDNTYSVDQSATVTFIVPAESTIKGKFWAYDPGTSIDGGDNSNASFTSKELTFTNAGSTPKAVTIELTNIFKRMIAAPTWWRSQFRFKATSTTMPIAVYVDWDKNKLNSKKSFTININSEDQANLALNVNGKTYTSGTTLEFAPDEEIRVRGELTSNNPGKYNYRIVLNDVMHQENDVVRFNPAANSNTTIECAVYYQVNTLVQVLSFDYSGNKVYKGSSDAANVTYNWGSSVHQGNFAPIGSTVSVTAAPVIGYDFVGWLYDWSSVNSQTISVTVRNAEYPQPVFVKKYFDLTTETGLLESGAKAISDFENGKTFNDFLKSGTAADCTLKIEFYNSGDFMLPSYGQFQVVSQATSGTWAWDKPYISDVYYTSISNNTIQCTISSEIVSQIQNGTKRIIFQNYRGDSGGPVYIKQISFWH